MAEIITEDLDKLQFGKVLHDRPTMAAFGASDAACYLWPGDSVDDRLCRAAFCAGAAWAVKTDKQ